MKSIIICLGVIILLIQACKKESSPASKPKLVQIKDSLYVVKFEYNTSGQISEMWLDSMGWWQNYTALNPPVKYLSFSYSPNYVRATYPSGPNWWNSYIEYFFNNSDYPVTILAHRDINGIDSVVRKTNFYYKPNSVLVDSILSISPADYSYKYVPQYSGMNIIQYTATKTNYPGAVPQTYHFTYNSLPNYYRATNPYLFIYTNPHFDPNPNDAWIPMIFSANAVSTFTAYGLTSNVTQLVNSYNQLQYENWGIHHPYHRLFVYE